MTLANTLACVRNKSQSIQTNNSGKELADQTWNLLLATIKAKRTLLFYRYKLVQKANVLFIQHAICICHKTKIHD